MTSKDDAKTAIYTRLASVSAFHPSSADMFHDFTLQSGDIVSVKSGEDTYSVPVYGMHMKWNGKSTVTIGNSGARKRPTLEKMAQRASRSVGGAYRAEKKRQTRLEWIVGIDEDGEYFVDHPGAITMAINEAGRSITMIDADYIYLGTDQTVGTWISGKVYLDDVTADFIAGKIASISLLNVQAIASANGYSAYAYLNKFRGNYYEVNISTGGGGSTTRDLVDGVYDVRLVSITGGFKLQKKDIKTNSWTDAGSISFP